MDCTAALVPLLNSSRQGALSAPALSQVSIDTEMVPPPFSRAPKAFALIQGPVGPIPLPKLKLIPSAGRGLMPSSPMQQVLPPISTLNFTRKLVIATPPAISGTWNPPPRPFAAAVICIMPLLPTPPLATQAALPATVVPAGIPELKSVLNAAAWQIPELIANEA